MKNKFNLWSWLAVSTSLLLLNCSSSGGGSSADTAGGDVAGIEIAEQIALVTASESGGAGVGFAAGLNLSESGAPTAGEFVTDEVHTRVYDESMKPLDQVNSIICMVSQTRFDALVNQSYNALIDNARCNNDGGDPNQSGQSSGQSQDLELWKVITERASAEDSEIVKVWIPQTEDSEEGGAGEIKAKMELFEGMSDSNPFGEFNLNFSFLANGVSQGGGNLFVSKADDSDLIELGLVMDEGEGNMKVHAMIDHASDSGQAIVQALQNHDGQGLQEMNIEVAFNENYYLVDYGPDGQQCKDRKNFDETVWQYNLYKDTGERLDLDAGFPIHTVANEGERSEHGWAGYYGIWLPDSLGSTNGITVKDEDDNSYTVFQGEGRLVRRTKSFITLGELEGVRLQHFDHEEMGNFIVEWMGDHFEKVAVQSCDQNGCNIQNFEIPQVVDLEAFDWFGIYSETLGYIDLVVPEEGLSNDTVAPYYHEEFVLPNDETLLAGALELKCYSNCLKPNLTTDEIRFNDLYLPQSFDPYIYTFDSERFVLQYEGQDIVIPDDVQLQGTQSEWGVRTGAMVLENVTITNPWEIYSQDTTYSYETGRNNWNKQMVLIDALGSAVEFEKPLNCYKSVDGYGLVRLNYAGLGNLHGIPFVEDTENFREGRYQPAFSIDDGSALECDDGNTYYTKQMVREQIMQTVDTSLCADLTLGGIELPTNTFTDPELGDAPTIDTAPKTIGGVLVE